MEIGNPYHYRGNPAQQINGFASLNSIPAEAHRSGIRLAPNVTSWDRNLSMPAAPYIFNTPDGDLAVMRTSSNIFSTPIGDYRKHGYFSQVDDISNFNGWLDAGTKSKPVMFEEVPTHDKSHPYLVTVSFGEKQARFMHGDTFLRKYVHDIEVENLHLNNLGAVFQRAHNAKYDLIKYYRTENAEELAAYLESLGHTPEMIDRVGVTNSEDAGIYGVGKLDGRTIFLSNEKAKEMLARWGKRFGASVEEMVEFALDEEFIHLSRGFDRDIDRIVDETETKETALEHYGRRISMTKGEERRSYQRKARVRIDDIETVPQRYKRGNYHAENLESLVDSWKAEARSMRIDETEYVSAKMATHPVYGRKGKDYSDKKPTYRATSRYKGKDKEARGRDKGEKGGEKAEMTNAKAAQEDSGENPEGGEAEPVESQEEASPQ